MTDAAAVELRQAVASATKSLEEMRGAGMPNVDLEAKLEIITRTTAQLIPLADDEGTAGAEIPTSKTVENPLDERAAADEG